MSRALRLAPAMILIASIRCAGREPGPAALDTKTEMCRSCRMPVSDQRLSAQLVAAGEEPRFFDDIACLRDDLIAHPAIRGSVAYVADHRSGQWVRAEQAVFTKCPAIETPMGSHLIAHADGASRDADPKARGSAGVPAREIFGPLGPPGGKP